MTSGPSSLGDELASRLRERSVPCRQLSLTAVHEGRAVALVPGKVRWEGASLEESGAVFVDRPVFLWPQPQRIGEYLAEPESMQAKAAAEREASSLLVSALWILADRVPVLPHPRAARFASSPVLALDHLDRQGFPVHAWRVAAASEAQEEERVLDVVGRDLWAKPGIPEGKQPALILRPVQDELVEVLVLGGEVVAHRHPASRGGWPADEGAETRTDADLPVSFTELVRMVTAALELDVAALTLSRSPDAACVLFVDAGPDLGAWNSASQGEVVLRLARCLIDRSEIQKGITP